MSWSADLLARWRLNMAELPRKGCTVRWNDTLWLCLEVTATAHGDIYMCQELRPPYRGDLFAGFLACDFMVRADGKHAEVWISV